MELEVRGLTGAGYGEKSSERLAQRNGYRNRSWETRAEASACCTTAMKTIRNGYCPGTGARAYFTNGPTQ
jgi:hypothetical protein